MTHTSPAALPLRGAMSRRASSGIGLPRRSVQGLVVSGGGIWPRKGHLVLSLGRCTQRTSKINGAGVERLSDSVRSVVGVGSDSLTPRAHLDPLSRIDSLLVNDVPLQRRDTGRWDSLDYFLPRCSDRLQGAPHIAQYH